LTPVEVDMHKKRYDEGKHDTAFESMPTAIHILSEPYWEAFWCLHRSRTFDMNGNPNALSLTEMKAWLDLFPEHDINVFIYLISAVDNAYLLHISQKLNDGDESKPSKGKS